MQGAALPLGVSVPPSFSRSGARSRRPSRRRKRAASSKRSLPEAAMRRDAVGEGGAGVKGVKVLGDQQAVSKDRRGTGKGADSLSPGPWTQDPAQSSLGA
ncbi:unnamed protein product [Rangifer tarandus platyrhynchus]|uniref:Uncharacterized protein n=2 Tax=Rangifer tarandus platyrhynchus TaxID=3082113 RepID=A0ABN8Y9Z4_RANTA|nr:unnamed protein product [Rangifer tarandus platyrhynchus]CAI9695334.1 unnamed protein product [Rangifer tarandus platyrhynchus]